jgi:uncharacterized protein
VNRVRIASVGFGMVFGFLISWAQVTDPDVIQDMLQLQSAYVYLLMASSIAVGFVGIRLLRARRANTVLTGEPVNWSTERPERRHVVGSTIFGIGWAVSCACPGPIVAQLGQGFAWSLFTAGGLVTGVLIYLRTHDARAPAQAPAAGGVAYASAPE